MEFFVVLYARGPQPFWLGGPAGGREERHGFMWTAGMHAHACSSICASIRQVRARRSHKWSCMHELRLLARRRLVLNGPRPCNEPRAGGWESLKPWPFTSVWSWWRSFRALEWNAIGILMAYSSTVPYHPAWNKQLEFLLNFTSRLDLREQTGIKTRPDWSIIQKENVRIQIKSALSGILCPERERS